MYSIGVDKLCIEIFFESYSNMKLKYSEIRVEKRIVRIFFESYSENCYYGKE